MPRRYDSDDIDDFDDDDQQDAGPLWRRRLITWSMAAVALGLGFLIPYTLYLNQQVTQRFGELRWQIPTRVYARPLELAPGLALDASGALSGTPTASDTFNFTSPTTTAEDRLAVDRLLPDFDTLVLMKIKPLIEDLLDWLEARTGRPVFGVLPYLHGLFLDAEDALADSAADVLTLCSSREGWANVLLEAMACGTPVIATDIWGTPEVVTCDAAGQLMAERNAQSLAEAWHRLRGNPPERSATRAYAEGFSWNSTTQGQLALFRRVLAQGAS